MPDALTRIIDETLARSAVVTDRIRRGSLRESAGGKTETVELLDLREHGVPAPDGAAAPGTVEILAESDDPPVLDGVPMTADYDPAAIEADWQALRESQRAAAAGDDGKSLLDIAGCGVPMREGTYGGENGGDIVYYEDANTRQDVADLYAVVPELTPAGSPNLENSKLRGIQEHIERGQQLAPVEIGVVRELLAKYGDQVKKLRESPDREGQDLHSKPDPGTARVVDRQEQDGEGLIDLGDLTKAPVAA
jgi:hypothetical protein